MVIVVDVVDVMDAVVVAGSFVSKSWKLSYLKGTRMNNDCNLSLLCCNILWLRKV